MNLIHILKSVKVNYRNKRAGLLKGWKIHYSKKLSLYFLLNLDNYIDYLIFVKDHFEPQVLKAIQLLIEKKNVATFVDVGSNIGQMSLYVARKFPQVQVLSFEAYYKNYRQHASSMLLNDLEYDLFNVAVSDSEEPLTLYLPKTQEEYDYGKFNSGMTSINLDSFREETRKIEVQAKTLTSLLEENLDGKNEGYVLVKIDVEGAELKVIKGFLDYISNNKGIIIIIEMLFEKDNSLYEEVRQTLYAANFEMYDIEMRPVPIEALHLNQNADFIFIKEH